ncbi:MAG: ATP-binding protein [Halobellus sp.]|uniref:hybrid sensor histidine kinase/response regulator n=1 Tax=Halobellus sp. TaxID=1979212 RepID=UPI0035D4E22E
MTSEELTLLLVEDNPSDVRLIEEYLVDGQWGQKSTGSPEVIHAGSLSEGIEAQIDEVDLVLLDLNLPDSAGLETLQSMSAASEATPLVVLTGLNDQQLGVKAVGEGAQDYLIKDEVSPELLQRTIRYAIERASQERELKRRNRELAVLNQIVRHDIRNDVSVITGWGTTLEDYVEPGGEEYLSRVLDSADHITQLTETVGDFLNILEGEQDADLRPSDLVNVLRAEIEKARSTHSEAEFTVEGELPDGVTVEANQMLSSVFRNLLNNAVTHNTEDTPRVTISLEVTPDTVQVVVADDGLGIPDDRKETVFGRGKMGLESPGSGIGLHLVDTLVDIYGGEVWIEDNEPTGSVFRVELPRA